ncbi:SCAN domain-containing protein 3 [Trichinella murrelli]|uniref:SCAN domain-containing protein 3 n=1 Tax=Trichinella murrelli TaxID=144512 RepID=A0A0V0TUI1_9BILA|nr:SCAN domain-containing protein 3 [Trichinella murrelli]
MVLLDASSTPMDSLVSHRPQAHKTSFQAKIGLFKSFLARRDFKYFSNLQKLEEGADVSDRDLEIYINHLEKLEEDFKIRFEDLESMTVPDWIIAPFDIETGNANIEFSLQEEHVEMSADLEAKLLFKHKSLSEFWSNVNITNKYPKLSAAAQPFLLAFPSSYLVEAGFSHVNAILSKQRNRLNLEMRGDLRLKLTNFQPNINALAAAHQTHPSH